MTVSNSHLIRVDSFTTLPDQPEPQHLTAASRTQDIAIASSIIPPGRPSSVGGIVSVSSSPVPTSSKTPEEEKKSPLFIRTEYAVQLGNTGAPTFSNKIYEGPRLGGKYHGRGKLFFPNREVYYEGEFKDGKFDGHGKLNRNGDIFEGEFKDGELNEKVKVKITFTNGEFYEGQVRNYMANGSGTQINSRRIYEGQFENGKFHGHGKISFPNGIVYEEGEFRHGKYIGSNCCIIL